MKMGSWRGKVAAQRPGGGGDGGGGEGRTAGGYT